MCFPVVVLFLTTHQKQIDARNFAHCFSTYDLCQASNTNKSVVSYATGK